MSYIKGIAQEMKKVTWPTAKQVNKFTWTVIMMIIFFGLYFALTDFVFGNFIDWLVSLGA
ncbi:preprotein translocase subunit SecE [Facklamia sp. 7083-14-GEN3]|uniref:preprotein translocase subunit SecE n=1 Tax=Facklamia sp. 7083-14-GEN3 TaxID=2973478 RepID=UPI00215BCFE0|nr:preprotein translocase subunit SecE [Facklamia sp. 7083-14-GEN3]MCR8969828.1 preprotein translocase subunit SecE [Facklamia sp. 7083-14-GEN3]